MLLVMGALYRAVSLRRASPGGRACDTIGREQEQQVSDSDQESPEVRAFMVASLAEQAARLAAWGHPQTGALILVNGCESRCFFCINPGVQAPTGITAWPAIEAHLAANRSLGLRRLLLGGNEPTVHPRFDDALALAQQVGFARIELMTSGMQLAARLPQWMARGVDAIAAPIYAETAAVHDRICGSVSHARLLAGLDAAAAAGLTVHLHTLALQQTLAHLPALARFVRQRWGATLTVAPPRAKPSVFAYRDASVGYDALVAALDGAPAALLGFPLCVDPARPRGGAAITGVYFRTQRTGFTDVCTACTARPRCPGVVLAHLQHHQPRLVGIP